MRIHFRRMGLGFLLAYLLTPVAAMAQSTPDEVRCEYTHRVYCNASGCMDLPIVQNKSFLIVPALDQIQRSAQSVVRRCDDKGCTPVNVQAAPSGVFHNLASAPGGYLLKLALLTVELVDVKKGDFVEIATQNLGSFVGYGRCRFPER